MANDWVKPVMGFARAVMPNLLGFLGEERAGEAFGVLQDLYDTHDGDPAAALEAIREERAKASTKATSAAAPSPPGGNDTDPAPAADPHRKSKGSKAKG